jgi:tetratricopeptide (TPR) repeat protein
MKTMKTQIQSRTRMAPAMLAVCLALGCEDFLETYPYGNTSLQRLSQQESGAEALLIAAYSNLDGISSETWLWSPAASNWIFGSIAGGDAYKGSDQGDQAEITEFELHQHLNPLNPYLEGKWATYYQGISRANDAIEAFRALGGISEPFRNTRIAEARFLRGFFHFELRKLFGSVPYIDETMEDVRVGNTSDILDLILDDFQYASANLPATQYEHIGRITKGAAQSYIGICYMWQKEFTNASIYFDSVILSGRYALNAMYHDNFNVEDRNSPESILEVQQSVNDGGVGVNGGWGDVLNYPNAPGYCCGFHQPSQNLVNAFKTDPSGLPLLDTFNDSDVTNDDGLTSTDPFTPYSGSLDPRLDWTVGRRGIPYLDWGKHPGYDWIRDQGYGGPYSPKKNVIYKTQESAYSDNSGWTTSLNANNLKLLRYADLLLYAAEAEVELNDLSRALELVNLVRARAANPAGYVMDGPSPAANYLISSYPSFPDQDYARKAVRFERRLELGMEGHRFFDLVRWGIAAQVKNEYFMVEKDKRPYLKDGLFEAGKHEVLPIPQNAIDLSRKNGVPTLVQNPGY